MSACDIKGSDKASQILIIFLHIEFKVESAHNAHNNHTWEIY